MTNDNYGQLVSGVHGGGDGMGYYGRRKEGGR